MFDSLSEKINSSVIILGWFGGRSLNLRELLSPLSAQVQALYTSRIASHKIGLLYLKKKKQRNKQKSLNSYFL